MKLKTILFSAVLVFASIAKSTAQTAQHDSLRIHIEENKNGNMLIIDTAVAASQHDQLMLWLNAQGIETPGMPEGHDSMQVVLINIEGDGDSLPNGMRIIEGPVPPPDAPLPPPAPGQKMRVEKLPPPPTGADGKNCRMVIIRDTVVRCDNMKTKTGDSNQQQQGKMVVKTTPDSKALTVFPNPSNGHITVTIDMPGKEKADLTITDMNGKTVYSEQLGTETEKLTKEIDLSKFGKGMYNVEVHKGGNVLVKRIEVQ